MSTLQKRSAYIVHTQIIGLGDRSFPSTKRLRSVWHPLFDSKDCFTDLYTLIQDVSHVNHLPWEGRKELPAPSKPFIRNLGSICFNTRSVRLAYGKDDRSFLAEHLGEKYHKKYRQTPYEENNNDEYFADGRIFGYDTELEDQRMNYLYFEVRKPLFLRAETNDDTRAEGKVFVHIYPSGYLALQLAVSLAWEKDRSLNDLRSLVQETRPWRRGNRWMWSSRLGNMTLHEVVERIKDNLQQSLYVNGSSLPRQDSWHSTLKLASDADAKQIATDLILARGHYEILDIQSTALTQSNLTYLLASRQGLTCVAPLTHKRKQALNFFWKILTIAEFVAFKHRVYDDYAKFLRQQVTQLRDFRLSIQRKLRNEDLFRFSVYDHKIPQFLSALDKHIRSATPFHRRIYSAISAGTGFDARRERVMKLVGEWETEVEQWEPSLSLLWKKVISPIRSLIGSR